MPHILIKIEVDSTMEHKVLNLNNILLYLNDNKYQVIKELNKKNNKISNFLFFFNKTEIIDERIFVLYLALKSRDLPSSTSISNQILPSFSFLSKRLKHTYN